MKPLNAIQFGILRYETGKYDVYTNEGDKVEILSTKGRQPYVLVGYRGDKNAPGAWTIEGEWQYRGDESFNKPLDLYLLPRPPKVIGYVNMYPNGVGDTHRNRARADERCGENRIGIIVLTDDMIQPIDKD